eukprot:08075.XXX_63507_63839_1 [CDS] Oithona nana genome sequencing.
MFIKMESFFLVVGNSLADSVSCHQLNCKFMRYFLSTHRYTSVVASRAENTEQRRCFSWSTSLGGFCCCKASSSASPKAFEALGSSLNVQPQKWLSLQRPFSAKSHVENKR